MMHIRLINTSNKTEKSRTEVNRWMATFDFI
jgi:hypothetical protein